MLTLRYHSSTTIPVEAECLTPDNLAGKSLTEITVLPVQYGNAPAPLGEFFAVSGDAADRDIVLEGDCSRVKWIGAAMTSGRVTVRGDIGMHAGSEMSGGELHILGNASDWAGAEMHGGLLHIRGNAGSLVGAVYRGGQVGMRGGTILVEGNAGSEVGACLRRGLIVVGGDIGEFVGMSMIAGSILIFGSPGGRPGAEMKRGSILFAGGTPALLPTFRFDCDYTPVFLDIYLQKIRSLGIAVNDRHFAGSWRRYSGDLVASGKGEILHRLAP
jgi:formylmethanofuran dehydrogenase subunit C